MVDVTSAASTCDVALDGVPNGQTIRFEKRPLSFGVDRAQKDALAETVPLSKPVSLFTCGSGYCNCEQAQAAVASFSSLVSAHVDRINSQATDESVKVLFDQGFVEKAVLLTGLFGDLGNPRKSGCTVNLAGNDLTLLPGNVYALKITVPRDDGRLVYENNVKNEPEMLVPQWSYATKDGLKTGEPDLVQILAVG